MRPICTKPVVSRKIQFKDIEQRLWVSVPWVWNFNFSTPCCEFLFLLMLGKTAIGWRCWEGGREWSDAADGNVEGLSCSITGTRQVRQSLAFDRTVESYVLDDLTNFCKYQLVFHYVVSGAMGPSIYGVHKKIWVSTPHVYISRTPSSLVDVHTRLTWNTYTSLYWNG